MTVFDALFSLATLILAGIYGIYWWEARRAEPARARRPGAGRAGG